MQHKSVQGQCYHIFSMHFDAQAEANDPGQVSCANGVPLLSEREVEQTSLGHKAPLMISLKSLWIEDSPSKQ